MRSSKSRSRAKGNRRSVGNIVNRVFDSSGPEGKVRGTPQQIIDKYTALARDATLANDRVAAENFQQHAEHYARMLGDAQRDADAKREQQEAQDRKRDSRGDDRGGERDERGQKPGDQGQGDKPARGDGEGDGQKAGQGGGDVVDMDSEADTNLVETPENTPAKRRGGGRKKAQGGDEGGASEAKAAE
ncbi:DUF4167 domain-containing protein [Rhodovulum sp. YNF3179]|uniref:DUF4167 domain-containing protein n=1 Tax=Rhodovulum sp. YNF3179 TaxID=3425127 RepID=UPI003D32629F